MAGRRGGLLVRAAVAALAVTAGCATTDPAAFEVERIALPRSEFALGTGPSVESAIRRALAVYAPRPERESEARLTVRVERIWAELDPLSNPEVRSGQYRALVEVSARIHPERGPERTVRARGESYTLNHPASPVDAFEGQVRLALDRAAERAAEQLAYRVRQVLASLRKSDL